MDGPAARTFYEYTRWLVDRQTARQASIESRAAGVIGWSSAQIALTLGVITLASRIDDNGWRTCGLWLLGAAATALTAAVVTAVRGVLRTKSVAAPNVDLGVQWAELKGAEGGDIDVHLVEALVESLVGVTDAEPNSALALIAATIDHRGRAMRWAADLLAAAVVLDASAGILLIFAITL